jgi:hypothetical protein
VERFEHFESELDVSINRRWQKIISHPCIACSTPTAPSPRKRFDLSTGMVDRMGGWCGRCD